MNVTLIWGRYRVKDNISSGDVAPALVISRSLICKNLVCSVWVIGSATLQQGYVQA
jgi:hypothetical protein